MSLAILECTNADCSAPRGGEYELPEIDPEAPANAAQTDWPICDTCLEPLSLEEMVEVDDDLLLAVAQEVFEYYDLEGLKRLREVCAAIISHRCETDERGWEL